MLRLTTMLLRNPIQSCPTDPALRDQCSRFRKMNQWVVSLSAAIWIIGFIMAYLALPIRL